MLRYHYHCTDGADLIIDRRGRTAANDEQARREAVLVAERVIRELPEYDQWGSWVVCVYDNEQCMIGTVPFDRALPALAHAEVALREAFSWMIDPCWPSPHPNTRSH
jgi:hypothetical protein